MKRKLINLAHQDLACALQKTTDCSGWPGSFFGHWPIFLNDWKKLSQFGNNAFFSQTNDKVFSYFRQMTEKSRQKKVVADHMHKY